jgi:hypothetical protein
MLQNNNSNNTAPKLNGTMNENFKEDSTDGALKLNNTTPYKSETWVKRQTGCFTLHFLSNS